MALSSYYMQEIHGTNNNYSNPFEFCFDTSITCEENLSPFLESLGYSADISSFYNISSLYEQDEVFPAISPCERDLLPYNFWRSSDGEYDSCFASNDYTNDSSFSNAFEKTEIRFQGEEYGDNHLLNYDSLESQQLSVDDRCWSDCESWFGYANEEDSYYEKQCCYAVDETALFEGIFGYWPCLMQKQQLPYRD